MKTILVVDDEKNIRLLYKKEFDEEGYKTLLASNPAEAMEQFQATEVDLVILDIKLSESNGGLETLKKMRKVKKDLPIILNTAYSTYKTDFSSWLADAYIIKSSNLDELKEKVKELLK